MTPGMSLWEIVWPISMLIFMVSMGALPLRVARHLYHDAMIAAHTGTHYASLYDMNKAKEIIAISFLGAGGYILGNFASALGLLLPILGSHKISISTSHMIYSITWACSISYLWIAHFLWFNRTFPGGTTNHGAGLLDRTPG